MTWLPFYKEVAQVLSTYENRQSELLDLLRAMQSAGLKTISLDDLDENDQAVPLAEIDPFTFLATFHRTGEPMRFELWKYLRGQWSLSEPVPESLAGLPTVMANASRFLSWQKDRAPDEVATLWRVFQSAHSGAPLPQELWARALQIPGVGVAKLTSGLFWINAEKYLSLDSVMLKYLARYGITPNIGDVASDVEEYQKVLAQVHDALGYDHLHLSREAWETRNADASTLVTKSNTSSAAIATAIVPRKLPAFPLNRILYGPPGTGKTYSSVARAVEIIDGVVSDDRAETVKRFEELRAAGRIGFVTFHQSFAYEEFIEGLRPLLEDAAEGTARYEISDGAFKQMALRALAATLRYPLWSSGGDSTFEPLWDEFTRRVEENAPYEIAGLGTSKFRLELSPRGTIYGENLNGTAQKPYNTSRGKVREVWEKLTPHEKPSHKRLFAILERGAHTNLIGAIIEELRRLAASGENFEAVSTSAVQTEVSVQEAREWLNGEQALEAIESEAPRFVLVIDEINRGNISKIFGELITLLENDKRLGVENELRVVLPYSKESFGVPRNLYLLGTMNTADKSLALLDIALRRRFEFEELRPDFSEQKCGNLDATMRGVLQALNARLMRVLDREHRLGHAAWMEVATREDWNQVFLKQIVPLLQEYFYNDWDNLRAVLGESSQGKIVRELPTLDGVKSRTRYAWWFDYDETLPTPDFLDVLAKNFKVATAPQDITPVEPAPTAIIEAEDE